MSGYCFYSPDAVELLNRAGIKDKVEQFAESNKKQTYVLCRPLTKEDAAYDYEEAIAIFSSGMRPCFIDIGGDLNSLEDYADDFIEDVSYLSEKYKYREKIGRKKHWSSLFVNFCLEDFSFAALEVEKPSQTRIVDLITSLVVGSINDIKKVDLNAVQILDIVKSKIILFDTDQTSFVFRSGAGKKFVIQGLAGSGKTELLLHKLKELYSKDTEARIAFTCFNKILASSMKNRIPDFFDFMRVERQIDWNNKLFCFHSWGSSREPLSGMYRYICHCYGVPFGGLQAGSFDFLCKRAIEDIKSIADERKYAFDYVFIDESQDFPDSFIDLCDLVTSKKVFVAGDVFQNIFRPIDERVNRADMVLRKCYRTDPKNLMFSHALGMGLFEEPVLRWLKKEEWDACGYIYSEAGERAKISRDPLRRFEDVPKDFKSTSLLVLAQGSVISDSLIEVVRSIVKRNPTVKQGDIAILFLDKDNYIYDVIARLKHKIFEAFGWDVNVSHESKVSDPSKFFISNINNAKGLEFPFVICFALDLRKSAPFRNALYTMMARSFLESHLVLGKDADQEVVQRVSEGLDFMLNNGFMNLRIPSREEIDRQREFIVLHEAETIEDIVREFCASKGATPRLLAKLIKRAKEIVGDGDYEKEYLEGILALEYERNKSL